MVESVSPAVVSAMGQLYAVEPDRFMAERKRLAAEAKAAGDGGAATEIGKLRKPSVAGWAVNLVAREAPDELAPLLQVGERLRKAQSQLDMATLAALRPDRDAAVDRFVAAAVRVLTDRDRELSVAAQQEVHGTAIAAIADQQAATALASGQLVKALSYSGFGEVDLSDAIARTSSGAVLTVLEGQAADSKSKSREPARSTARETAKQAAATRAERIATAEAAVQQADQVVADAEAGVTEARRILKAAERARDAAAKELTAARRT